jgi:hypothetical protein
VQVSCFGVPNVNNRAQPLPGIRVSSPAPGKTCSLIKNGIKIIINGVEIIIPVWFLIKNGMKIIRNGMKIIINGVEIIIPVWFLIKNG